MSTERAASIDSDRSTHDLLLDLAERVEELEEEVETKDRRIRELEAGHKAIKKQLKATKKLLIGEGHASDLDAMRDLRESRGPINAQLAEVESVRSDAQGDILREVGKLRAEHGAYLREIAEETGVDLDTPTSGDLISRVRTDGVESVTSPTYEKHRRAEMILRNIEEWGEAGKERGKDVFRLERPRIRRLLSSRLDTSLQSAQAAAALDAIEELAEGTTRYTKHTKEHGEAVFYLGFPETQEVEEE